MHATKLLHFLENDPEMNIKFMRMRSNMRLAQRVVIKIAEGEHCG